MLRNMKVGTKLMATLVAPALVIVILVTIGVRDRLDVARSAGGVEDVARFAATSSELAQQLQIESVWSATVAASQGVVGRAELDAQRPRTDAAIVDFTDAEKSTDLGSAGGKAAEPVRFAKERLGTLNTLRVSVDTGQVLPYAIAESYSDGVAALGTLIGSLVQTASDAELLRGLETVAALQKIITPQSALAGQVVAAVRVGKFTDRAGEACSAFGTECDSYTRAEDADRSLVQANETFVAGRATPAEKQTLQNATAGQSFDELARKTLEQGTAGNSLTVSADELTQAALARIDGLAGVNEVFTQNVVTTASDLSSNATRDAILYLLAGIAALGSAFGLALVVARSVTRPLNRVTKAANRLSTEQLPALVEQLRNPDDESADLAAQALEPIAVDSRDEIGQLAEAFNSIQSVTVDVAEEQSRLLRKGIGDIFVHLARRNQSLLDRQIEFIDHLETHEEDPDQLDNLFKLDHLATRMRRNAESLLVLAGAEPPRRRGRPVPVVDVVRVAIGEVEDFARVHLIALDEATIAGNVAVDLAHLLSELMENATHFSPPESSVEILGRRDEKSGYVVTVVDRGIGMNAQQLAEANAQLARPPLVGLALSRSLGFIVIGRLASRFGLAVVLEPTPNGGTTASVTLPYSLVEYPGETQVESGSNGPASKLVSPRGGPSTRGDRPSRPTPMAASEARSTAVLPSREPVGAATAAPVTIGAGGLPSRRSVASGTATSRVTDSPVVHTATPASGTEPAPPGELTTAGLVRRAPKRATSTPIDALAAAAASAPRPAARSSRSPEEVRRMLSRYRSGLDRGRQGDGTTDTSPDRNTDDQA